MANTHTRRIDGKPDLFSWDLATEFQFIEQQAQGKPKEAQMLKKLARDFIDIIEKYEVLPAHVEGFEKIMLTCSSGIWEIVSAKLHVLTYHFEEVRTFVIKQFAHEENRIKDRSLSLLTEAFSSEDQRIMLLEALLNKSKKIRDKAAKIALELGNTENLPLLREHLDNETEDSVINSLQFAINNMAMPAAKV